MIETLNIYMNIHKVYPMNIFSLIYEPPSIYDLYLTHQEDRGFGPKPIRAEYEIESSPGADYVACHHTRLGSETCRDHVENGGHMLEIIYKSCQMVFNGSRSL